MREKVLFLKNFFRNPLRNASVIPSSKASSKAMLKGIDFNRVSVVVELGPGNGVFTQEIIKTVTADTKIIVFELEPTYINLLQNKFGDRITLVNKSAHLLSETLEELGIDKVDVIISGLPFLQGDIKQKTDEAIYQLTRRGTIYRFFTYMPGIMKNVYKELPIEKKYFELRNIPPLWVYGIN